MQVRLAHIGLRPIDILVDLTNYIMAELGQPMHAFDAANVDRIEVATAEPGEKFTTLDNVQRTMPEGALMIQCQRRSIALAGIMGGADTEVTPRTTELLLESANFEPATIRKCAAALGHRTDASARFEKSQDPHNTTLGIQRFVELARPELPDLKFTSRLSDSFPEPPEPTVVRVDPEFVSRYIGREIPIAETTRILEAIDFDVKQADGMLEVTVPTFRATKDIAIEADVIEEVARFVGYGSIDPVLPEVTVRYAEPDPLSQLERRILSLFCIGSSHAEIHRYIWFDNDWLKQLNYVPQETLTLRNPAASGMEKLRTTLIPGMLASVDLDRHTFDSFELLEIGSVFPTRKGNAPEDVEQRHLGLAVVAPGRKAKHEDAVLDRLKTDLETFAQQLLGASLKFTDVPADMPWEHEIKTAAIHLDSMKLGRISVLPQACKRRIDEHLAAWSIAICELNLSMLSNYQAPVPRLRPIPVFPRIDVDFSLLADASSRYQQTESALGQFDHPLLRALAFVDSYEGGSVPAGKRSFTFRATIGDPSRTLTEDDIQAFRSSFIDYAGKHGLTLRQK
jgi:phenylalanyl-tRNA synthetase beta chain